MDVQGKTIAVTGKFKDIQRKEIELELARRGALVAKSITGKTEILIAGERAGSKLAKAQSLGIQVVSEAELLAALKQEATVEVEAAAPKAAAVPDAYAGKTLPLFKGKVVAMTGKFKNFKTAQLKALLKDSGATVASGPRLNMDYIISGIKWGNKLREAITYKATVISEGELLLMLEGRTEGPEDFPRPEEVPCGETLSEIDAVEQGEMKLSLPEGAEGTLVLKWRKVPFQAHLRFLEKHGREYGGDHQYHGQLFYNGEALKPAALFAHFYGAESFCRNLFWECGSDFCEDYLIYDGEHGFNCSFMDLRRKRLHVNWSLKEQDGERAYWMYKKEGESGWFGSVAHDSPQFWLMVNLEKGLYAYNSHTDPYIIRPDNPYNN